MNKEEILKMNRELNDFEHDYIITKEKNSNLKQTLIDIREYIKNKRIGEEYFGNEPYMFETKYGKDILQIIDKVLGDEK